MTKTWFWQSASKSARAFRSLILCGTTTEEVITRTHDFVRRKTFERPVSYGKKSGIAENYRNRKQFPKLDQTRTGKLAKIDTIICRILGSRCGYEPYERILEQPDSRFGCVALVLFIGKAVLIVLEFIS